MPSNILVILAIPDKFHVLISGLQFVQFLKKKYAEEGKNVSIYAEGRVRVNNHPYQKLFDPTVDLAQEEWSHFSHHDWLLPFQSKYKKSLKVKN